jgi:hypothetical protein
MPTKPSDRHIVVAAAGGILTVALAAVALRSIASAAEVAKVPVATAGLETLAAFTKPLPTSSGLARPGTGTMVVARDPFFPVRSPVVNTAANSRPRATGTTGTRRDGWVVTSILIEGSRRSALVNDAWVSVGDALGAGSRVSAIERDHVVVTDALGARHVLSIQRGGP